MDFSAMLSRKLWIVVLILFLACVMCYLGKITGAEWVELTKWVSVAYLGANVAQKGVEKGKPSA